MEAKHIIFSIMAALMLTEAVALPVIEIVPAAQIPAAQVPDLTAAEQHHHSHGGFGHGHGHGHGYGHGHGHYYGGYGYAPYGGYPGDGFYSGLIVGSLFG